MNKYVIYFGSESIVVEGYHVQQLTEKSLEVETDYCVLVKIHFSNIIESIKDL